MLFSKLFRKVGLKYFRVRQFRAMIRLYVICSLIIDLHLQYVLKWYWADLGLKDNRSTQSVSFQQSLELLRLKRQGGILYGVGEITLSRI